MSPGIKQTGRRLLGVTCVRAFLSGPQILSFEGLFAPGCSALTLAPLRAVGACPAPADLCCPSPSLSSRNPLFSRLHTSLLSCSPLAPQPRRGDGLVTIRSPGAQLEFRVQPGRRFPAPPHSPLLSPLPPRGRGGCALACSESAPPSALGDLFHAQPLLFCEPLPSVEHAVLPSRPLRSPPQCLVTGSAVIPGGSHQSCAPEPNPVDTVSPSPPRTTHVPSPHRPPREALQARRRLHCWPHTHICLPQLAVPCWVLW